MHWRRFAIKDIPTTSEAAFSAWLLARWREKDDLIEHYLEHGRFPADAGTTPALNGAKPLTGAGWIETEVRSKNPLEVFQILVPVAAFALVVNVLLKLCNMVLRLLQVR
jgi:lysocardiolipin and lysophospholipid acyltransferase